MTVGIVGLGLIGGSFARAVQAYTEHRVYGLDTEEVLAAARADGVIAGTLTPERLGQVDVLILCLYPGQIVEFLQQNAAGIAPGTLVFDCAGVKEPVCAAAFPLARAHGFDFLGGHPMAGKERSGFDASEASLFYNASYILVPGEAPQSATDTLVSLAKSMGFGTIKYCTQQKHDRMIAYTSQIPHVLACAYVMSPRCDEHSGFSAGSYRDVSRVARINAELWADLFLANREELADETEELVRNIERIRAAVAKNDRAELVALLSSAREKKEKFG